MPELPDVTLYVERLRALFAGQTLEAARLKSPFLLRTVEPRLGEAVGKVVRDFSRLGKRIVLALDDELYLVFHLMIAGRFHLKPKGAAPGKVGALALDFRDHTLMLTEASTKKRASLHVVRGKEALLALGRAGLEPLGASLEDFAAALRKDNHTLKRALTDPDVLSGIGNAYSDEILHAARLSPFLQTQKLSDDELARLHEATRRVLTVWIDKLRAEVGDAFPERVTAFRPEMAVHGKYKQPCPDCGAPVQRIVYAENEANYCARCQTAGRLLADRSLSRLLKTDWPKTLDELELRREARRRGAP